VLVLINADPDAIGCALAVKRLLWRHAAQVTIARINHIKRPDNLALIRLLKAPIVHIETIQKENFNRFVLVDSQPNHHPIFSQFEFNAVIDHHPQTTFQAPFSDIRPHYGAASSILTEYIKSAKIIPPTKIATALFYGIKTDTGNFERQAQFEDMRAFQYMFKYVNIHMVRKIESAELSIDFLKYYVIALQTMRLRNHRIFVHLGSVMNPDVCVSIADFFLRIHSVSWSIVSGVYQEELVVIFRNDGLQRDAGNLAKKAFGKFGSAGGHKSVARAQVVLSNIEPAINISETKEVIQWIMESIENCCKRKVN